MPKEVIYSGDEVVALTQKYLSKEDVAFGNTRPWFTL